MEIDYKFDTEFGSCRLDVELVGLLTFVRKNHNFIGSLKLYA